MTSVIIDTLGIVLPWLQLLKWTMVFLKSYPKNYWPYIELWTDQCILMGVNWWGILITSWASTSSDNNECVSAIAVERMNAIMWV